MKNNWVVFTGILFFSACSTMSSDPIALKATADEEMSKDPKTYTTYPDLVSGEKENCIEVHEKWKFERIHLDERSVVIEHRDPKKKTLTRAFANLLCVTELRDDERILRFSESMRILASSPPKEGSDRKVYRYGALPLKFTVLDEESKELKLRPTRATLSQNGAAYFLKYDGVPKVPHYVVVEVDSTKEVNEVLRSGRGHSETSIPIYGGGGAAFVNSSDFEYEILPVYTGVVEGDWIKESSAVYKDSR